MHSSDPPRHVNNLLHTLRGEQFRHSQNVRKDRTHLSSSHTHNSPTLPVSLYWPPSPAQPQTEIESSPAAIQTDTSDVAKTQRVDALSVVLSRLPSGSNSTPIDVSSEGSSPPSLTLLCLRLLLSSYSGPDFAEYIIPYLPPHLRRDLLRYTAVHAPLSNLKLYALCEPEGHADGELIVVGPQATLRADHFRKIMMDGSRYIHSGGQGTASGSDDLEPTSRASTDTDTEEEWDALHEEWSSSTPLQTFILVSCHISTSTLLTLPPTLTNLALVNLPSPVPLHRLPTVCPLLSVLDLSYNKWLVSTETAVRTGSPLDRIVWGRWNKLRVLALRGCHLSVAMMEKVNQGRWNDVEVIQ